MPIPENSGIGSRRLIFQAAVQPDDPPLYFRRYFMIEQGMKAPDFTLEDKDGNQVSLSQFLGQKVILYFYPRDNTCLLYTSVFPIGIGTKQQEQHHN